MRDYITAHLTEYKPPRPLRSSEGKQLVVIKTHLHYGDISFQVAVAKQFQESIEDVYILVELIVEDVLYGFMFQLRAFVFYIN